MHTSIRLDSKYSPYLILRHKIWEIPYTSHQLINHVGNYTFVLILKSSNISGIWQCRIKMYLQILMDFWFFHTMVRNFMFDHFIFSKLLKIEDFWDSTLTKQWRFLPPNSNQPTKSLFPWQYHWETWRHLPTAFTGRCSSPFHDPSNI